jgi:uroporphyrinogen-III synthase
MFTSAQQLYHLLQVGADLGLSAELLAGLNEIKVASIGPTCTEALQEHGIPILLEPSHPKMGHLVKESLEKMRGMEM